MRNAFVSLVLLFAAVTGRGDEPRFLIETLRVNGLRFASPEIVVAETRLREGRIYSEQDLGEAIGRVERLPFVLYADFRLEKGTAPGRYVLAISIQETKPMFVSARSVSSWISTRQPILDRSRSSADPVEYRSDVVDFRNEFLTVGGRFFIGAKGMVHAAAEVHRENRYTVGYTQYDVFGTRASISALVSYQDRKIGGLPGIFAAWHRADDFSYQLLTTVPITTSQSIRASWQRSIQPVVRTEPSIVPGSIRYTLEPVPANRGEVVWAYDTTNDAFFPTAGTLLTAGAVQYESSLIDDFSELRTDKATNYAITSERFFALSRRQALSAGLDLHRRGLDEVRAHGSYSINLWSREKTLRLGDLHFETGLDRSWLRSSVGRRASSTASAGLVYRNAWGVVRLDFEYVGWRNHE
ncbi:MAG TPA: hypothetical protein VFT12_02655 [Thermoanaerobaculia bacterium]|nr:hypothetical protein [Thermoanaerobaculia bacterium]